MIARPAASVPAYVPAPRQGWFAAVAAVFAVLHDIHWRAPWDAAQRPSTENVCKPV